MSRLSQVIGGLSLFVVLSSLIAIVPFPAQAWRDDGHYITCHIALLELRTEVRAEVARLIALDPSTQIFEEGCIWPDDVKYTTHRETEPWHYMNAPRGGRLIDMANCTAERGCLLSAIALHIGVLRNPASLDLERLEALKYLGHWLGDVHQPLHFGRAEDRGGNNVHVIWQAAADPVSPMMLNPRETNIHRVWDHEMLDDLRLQPFRYGTRLWMSISDEERSAWDGAEPIDWAQESMTIATAPETQYADHQPGQVLILGREYLKLHFPTVEARLKMGGVRLGQLLNALLLKSPEAAH